MATITVGNMTIMVKYYLVNNGLDYFQFPVPRALQQRVGKKTIKKRLQPDQGHIAIQCARLPYVAPLFRVVISSVCFNGLPTASPGKSRKHLIDIPQSGSYQQSSLL